MIIIERDEVTWHVIPKGPTQGNLAFITKLSDADRQVDDPDGEITTLLIRSINGEDPLLAPPDVQWEATFRVIDFLTVVANSARNVRGALSKG